MAGKNRRFGEIAGVPTGTFRPVAGRLLGNAGTSVLAGTGGGELETPGDAMKTVGVRLEIPGASLEALEAVVESISCPLGAAGASPAARSRP